MNYLSNLMKLNNRLLIVKKYNLNNNVRIISTKTTINFYQQHTQQQHQNDKNYTNDNNNNNNNNKHKQWYRNNLILLSSTSALAFVGLGIYTIYKYHNVNNRVVFAEQNQTDKNNYHRTVREDLPTYRMSDVSKYNSKEAGGIWITYGIGVYDITKFIPEHPGSDKIMLGAGNAIDPFWQIYQQHNTPEILKLLETFRIGNLNPADEQPPSSQSSNNNPWANEPKRHPILRAVSEKPFNAEPPPTILVDSFITPVEFFYVRNHLPVPKIDIDDYELEVEIENTSKKLTINYKELNKLPKYSVTAAIMCSGNRRSEMHKVKPIKGLSWSTAAVGNAIWTGPKLYDILRKLNVESDERRHVHFEGLDIDPTATPYAASIPLAKAMDPRSDIILAIEMNGKPLNRDHGYPVRVVVPGVTGARSVKWLGRICVSEKESDSHWQQNDYKGFSPSTDWDTVDFSKSTAIQNMPVTSAICLPENGKRIQLDNDNCVNVQGYAWSGGGNSIVRVDITIDGGKTWHVADLINDTSDGDDDDDGKTKSKIPTGRSWSWTLWTIKIPVSKGIKEMEIWSKAVDSNYNVQPETFENTWNLRGVLSNAYHRIKVVINNK